MNIEDIGRDVTSGVRTDIERAYRALVGYPHEEGVEIETVASFYAALGQVCDALADDQSMMPSATCESAGMRPGSTYAEGAVDFRAHPGPWMQRIQSAMGGK